MARSLLRWAPALRPRGFLPARVGLRHFGEGDVPKKQIAQPKQYFDFAAFRKSLRDKKEMLHEAEIREVRREYAKPPPEGWTVLTFLEAMDFGEGAEEVANLFETWNDFISMAPRDVSRLIHVSVAQRRKLDRHITLYNHGLWPKPPQQEFALRFAGKPLKREGKPWTEQEDRELLRLAELYDVNFGDPWLYLSWEMQRHEDVVRDRYMELVVKPREKADRCEIAITKSSRPLYMNRKFRMIPPDLYLVPSESNFKLVPSSFKVPAAFRKFRQDDIF